MRTKLPEQERVKVDPVDLRSITRYGDKLLTTVTLYLDWNTKVEWLKFGQAELQYLDHSKTHLLKGYLKNATDFEHDSAYAIRLPIIGLQFDQLWYHTTHFTGRVAMDQDGADDFHVPRAGYNPLTMEGSYKCKECKGKESHIIVPEGHYVPPFDLELFKAVQGKRVEITVGPNYKENEDE